MGWKRIPVCNEIGTAGSSCLFPELKERRENKGR
jgi:hypothetical protein